MLPELWSNISKYLNEKDIQKLIKMKILSNEYICKICSFEREIVIEDKIYYKYSFFDTQIGLERTIKKILKTSTTLARNVSRFLDVPEPCLTYACIR